MNNYKKKDGTNLGRESIFFSFLMKTDKGRQWWWRVQYWFCPTKSDHPGNGDSIATLYYFQQPNTSFSIPFSIFLLIFSAPFFFSLFSVSTRGIGTLLLRTIMFNNSTPFLILFLFFSQWGPKKVPDRLWRGTRHAFHCGATTPFLFWAMIGLWPWGSTVAVVSNTSDLSYPPPPASPPQFTDTHCSELNQLNIDSL